MNGDRELLEMAAKAAGEEIFVERQQERDEMGSGHIGLWLARGRTAWNPLQDDGDALRLAVKLALIVICDDDPTGPTRYTLVEAGDSERLSVAVEKHGDDPYAATRRAIVRAAAEIGKASHDR